MKRQVVNDKYKKARGGYSRLLKISCERCGYEICHYQKDGPGILKRMYFDRMVGVTPSFQKVLVCISCKETLGVPIVYKKEGRQAYRLFVGAISKKITKI